MSISSRRHIKTVAWNLHRRQDSKQLSNLKELKRDKHQTTVDAKWRTDEFTKYAYIGLLVNSHAETLMALNWPVQEDKSDNKGTATFSVSPMLTVATWPLPSCSFTKSMCNHVKIFGKKKKSLTKFNILINEAQYIPVFFNTLGKVNVLWKHVSVSLF